MTLRVRWADADDTALISSLNAASASGSGADRRGYFARFHTSVAELPPTTALLPVYFSSSPEIVNERFCSVPSQFG